MSRIEFMMELESYLMDISEEERKEALAFYDSYFEEADDDEAVSEMLGLPEQVAESIKKGLASEADMGEYSENGFRLEEEEKDEPATRNDSKKQKWDRDAFYKNKANEDHDKGMDQTTKILLIIAIVVLGSPVWGSVLGTLFGILAGIIGLMVGILALGIGGIAGGIFGGIGVFCASIAAIASGAVAEAVLLFGISFIMIAIGLFCIMLMILFIGKFMPWLWKNLVKLIEFLWGKIKLGVSKL